MKPIIAIIVSSHNKYANEFLKRYNLDPDMFKIVTEIGQLSGIHKTTPIIRTYGKWSDNYGIMLGYIERKFNSIRYIDY